MDPEHALSPHLIRSAPADASDLDLLREFEPVLRFTKGERFYPFDVHRYVAESSLWVYHPDGTERLLVDDGDLTMDDLSQTREHPFGSTEFLRFNKDVGVTDSARIMAEAGRMRREAKDTFHPGMGRLARGGFLPRIMDAVFSLSILLRGTVPPFAAAAAEVKYQKMLQEHEEYTYYGRVSRHNGWVVLQYWFFYCYNDWRSRFHGANDHEGDWENVLVYLYEEDGRLYPEWLGSASHDFQSADLRRRWDDDEQLLLVDGHPVVWAAAGSHAGYFQKGEYQATVVFPVPKWVRSCSRARHYIWSVVLGQESRTRDPFRIPFVDYARGDGKSIGPGQPHSWTPVVIDPSTPWVREYRGVWGLYIHDPIFGEDAPAGPMYDRDGSPRRSWYDPLGFVALDREPPPPQVAGFIERERTQLEARQKELRGLIAETASEIHGLGVRVSSVEGNPHLETPHRRSSDEVASLSERLQELRKEMAENEAVLGALKHRAALHATGWKPAPRAHVSEPIEPVPQKSIRFNRAAETWGAISLSLGLLVIVALLVLARSYLWTGILLMVITLLLVESILRGHYARTINGLAVVFAVFTAGILLVYFWLWVIVAMLALPALFLLVQKLRELWR